MTVSIIVAASLKTHAIGFQGNMPWHIPKDLKRFKQLTLGKPVIMGRKTFESIGKPLPNRTNIIVSKTLTLRDGITICSSLDEAINNCHGIPEIMIIGGEQIYRQALPLCNKMYLTHVFMEPTSADTWFPEFNQSEWDETYCESHEDHIFQILERKPL